MRTSDVRTVELVRAVLTVVVSVAHPNLLDALAVAARELVVSARLVCATARSQRRPSVGGGGLTGRVLGLGGDGGVQQRRHANGYKKTATTKLRVLPCTGRRVYRAVPACSGIDVFYKA